MAPPGVFNYIVKLQRSEFDQRKDKCTLKKNNTFKIQDLIIITMYTVYNTQCLGAIFLMFVPSCYLSGEKWICLHQCGLSGTTGDVTFKIWISIFEVTQTAYSWDPCLCTDAETNIFPTSSGSLKVLSSLFTSQFWEWIHWLCQI